jgi:hypothetical protein
MEPGVMLYLANNLSSQGTRPALAQPIRGKVGVARQKS